MPAAETTAAELVEAELVPERATDRMRRRILERLSELTTAERPRSEALAALFGETVLETATLETLVTSLLAGSHILVLGPPGSGKTTLAKELWELYPKELFAVADCPVHDDPFSLIDPAFSRRVPPCPYCKVNHGGVAMAELGEFDPSGVAPADVPVRRVRLREGYGFARVQGSPEVFPDNLTGSINLSRLEEVGDPTSPLVLEPGKLLQAHRGILLVDEVGKLPRGTQNVLLQALQEAIVSPAKTRETFPADVVAVTTSNMQDLGNITEPLNDRLSNVYTPFPTDASSNRLIVDRNLRGVPPGLSVPGPYRDAAVELILSWRERMDGGRDLSEVGSNRTLIDVLRRTRGYAQLTGARVVDPDDLHRGARDAMTGRIRARSEDGFAENKALVTDFLEAHWREAGKRGAVAYWCRYFEGELAGDKAEGARVVQAVREALAEAGGDSDKVLALTRQHGGDARVRKFAAFVAAEAGASREELPELLPATFQALQDLGAFEEQ